MFLEPVIERLGAAEAVEQSVATPIEQEVNGVEGMLYLSSSSTSDGTVAVTDYTGYIGTQDVVPDVVTMNKAHSSHYTLNPDPGIGAVLQFRQRRFGVLAGGDAVAVALEQAAPTVGSNVHRRGPGPMHVSRGTNRSDALQGEQGRTAGRKAHDPPVPHSEPAQLRVRCDGSLQERIVIARHGEPRHGDTRRDHGAASGLHEPWDAGETEPRRGHVLGRARG